MVTIDTPAHTALDAATRRVGATVASVAGQVATALGTLAASSLRVAERDLLNLAQFELRRGAEHFRAPFLKALQEKVRGELAPRADADPPLADRDWQTLSLVDDAMMEERLHADRLAQSIAHACDAELRELSAHLASLLQADDVDRHPLRPALIGAIVYRAIESTSREAEPRKILAREFGRLLEKTMPPCYAEIVRELQSLGVRPAPLVARGVETHGSTVRASFGGAPGRAGKAGASRPTDFAQAAATTGFDSDSTLGGERRPSRDSGGLPGGSSSFFGPAASTRSAAMSSAQADAAMMSLLRRLTAVASAPGALAALSAFGAPVSSTTPRMRCSASSRSS